VYAEDIILLAPSVATLQRLVSLCEENLQSLELAMNIKKSHSCTGKKVKKFKIIGKAVDLNKSVLLR